jgi:hypothetical protein
MVDSLEQEDARVRIATPKKADVQACIIAVAHGSATPLNRTQT